MLIIKITFIIFGFIVYKRIKNLFTFDVPTGLNLFVGPPGSGKTTLCAYLAYKSIYNNSKYVVCNVPILGTCKMDLPSDFEKYNFTNVSTVLVDEAGIIYNNRKYKTMSDATIEFAKMWRHHHVDNFIMFSQGVDIDITFLRLVEHIYLIHRSSLKNYVSIREVQKDTAIDENTHQLADCHTYVKGGHHLVYMPKYWPMFDSYELPEKPEKDWKLWGSVSRYKQAEFDIKLSELPYPLYLFNMLYEVA